VLSPLLVIALLFAAFEGYGFYTRHQKTTYARGGAFGAGSQQAAQSHSSTGGRLALGGHGKTPGGKPKITNGGKHIATLGSGSGRSGTTSQSGSSTGSSGSQSVSTNGTTTTSHPGHSHTTNPSSSPTASLVTPTPGVYPLAVTGQESAKFGPISACHNTFPSRSSIVVHHATGESPTSYDFDMRLYPNQANKHDERHIYKYSKQSMVLSYEQETVTCSGIKQSSAVSYSPAQTRVQLPLAVGNTWHNKGGGSARTETGTSNVVKRSSLQVGGTSYQVYEIVTKLALTGNETGERDQTWWYAPSLGVPLKFSETLHGHRSGANYAESYTATVIGLP
jgi:hypothetical protein